MRAAGNDEPCMFCGEAPASGAWGRPCPTGYKRVHWTHWQFQQEFEERLARAGRALSRAALELEKTATRISALPPHLLRKVVRECEDLDPMLIHNEAERARDALHLEGLLDV